MIRVYEKEGEEQFEKQTSSPLPYLEDDFSRGSLLENRHHEKKNEGNMNCFSFGEFGGL